MLAGFGLDSGATGVLAGSLICCTYHWNRRIIRRVIRLNQKQGRFFCKTPVSPQAYQAEYALPKAGLLTLEASQDHAWANTCSTGKVFAVDPARIYISIKDKYPCGSTDETEVVDLAHSTAS